MTPECRRDRQSEEGRSADKGRGPIIGFRDVRGLMKSLEILTFNMGRMARRVTALSKGDSTLKKLSCESVQEIKKVREWIDFNAETDGKRRDSRTVATQMTPTEQNEISRRRVSVASQTEFGQSTRCKRISSLDEKKANFSKKPSRLDEMTYAEMLRDEEFEWMRVEGRMRVRRVQRQA